MNTFDKGDGLSRFGAALALIGVVFASVPQPTSAQSFGRVKVFVGPAPDVNGFTRPRTKDFEDSYRDMRAAYVTDRDLSREIELVDDISRADIAVELVDRGSDDTGQRVQAPSVIIRDKNGRPTGVMPGASSPVTAKTLDARLVVLGTNYDIELEGKGRTYRALAKDILEQVAAWARQNRDQLGRTPPRS